MEEMELVVRCHMNKDAMRTYVPGTDIKSDITSHIMQTDSILVRWEKVASVIPPAHEKYSLELLKAIAELWINICGFSFAEGLTSFFDRKFVKHGIRNTLKKKGTDKECV